MDYFIDTMLASENQDDLIDVIMDTVEFKLDGQFVMKNIGITSRVFNHYAIKGIVPFVSKVGDYKYKFSFLDLIWFNIVRELREFGYPLEKIKIVKNILLEPILLNETLENITTKENRKKLMNPDDILGKEFKERIKINKELEQEFFSRKNNPDGARMDLYIKPLQLIFGRFLFDRADVRLLIDSNGSVFPFSTKTIKNESLTKKMITVGFDSESYISISILKFLKTFILKKENQNFVKDNDFINENELYILSLIREGKAKSITIKFENEKPTVLDITKEIRLQVESRISDVLLRHSYQEIEIKTQDGNIAFGNVTTKIKLK